MAEAASEHSLSVLESARRSQLAQPSCAISPSRGNSDNLVGSGLEAPGTADELRDQEGTAGELREACLVSDCRQLDLAFGACEGLPANRGWGTNSTAFACIVVTAAVCDVGPHP